MNSPLIRRIKGAAHTQQAPIVLPSKRTVYLCGTCRIETEFTTQPGLICYDPIPGKYVLVTFHQGFSIPHARQGWDTIEELLEEKWIGQVQA